MADENDLTENQVVAFVADWLQKAGFALIERPKVNRQKGDDIAAKAPDGTCLYVECKGSISQAGGQLKDWDNSAMAIFGAIKETEERRPEHSHAIAVPNTANYRRTIGPLDGFLTKQKITLFWVHANGQVSMAGAPNPSTRTSRFVNSCVASLFSLTKAHGK